MEQVEMTREELDEAIAELHEPKPEPPQYRDYREWSSEKWFWRWVIGKQLWVPIRKPTIIIDEAKRLTDELVKEGWKVKIEQHSLAQFTVTLKNFQELTSVIVRAKSEALALSMAYYEAKTGKRVVIKDE